MDVFTFINSLKHTSAKKFVKRANLITLYVTDEQVTKVLITRRNKNNSSKYHTIPDYPKAKILLDESFGKLKEYYIMYDPITNDANVYAYD